MNNKTIFFIAFIMGATAGAVATWRYTKQKYERIAQEEIDSVKEVFSRRESDRKGELTVKTAAEGLKDSDKPSIGDVALVDVYSMHPHSAIAEYAAILQKTGYTDYAGTKNQEKKETLLEAPCVIRPEEFGDDEEYECISLTYFADKILADENDEIIEDAESVVGFESLSHFGEFEDDSVYVKNTAKKCYYEILLDERNYSDVRKHMPHPVEVR